MYDKGIAKQSLFATGGMNMSETKRVFLIVLDSFGIGEAPDAANFMMRAATP